MAAKLTLLNVVAVQEKVVGVEGLVAMRPIGLPVDVVGAALRYQYYLGGRGSPGVGVGVAGDGAELLQGSLGGAQDAVESETKLDVIHVHAIQGDVGLVTPAAVDAAPASVIIGNPAVPARAEG